MKIGIFTAGYQPVNDKTVKATEMFAYKLSTALANRGHNVHVFGSSGTAGNFEVQEIESLYDIVEDGLGSYSYSMALVNNFANCIKMAEKLELDVIHDNTNTFPLVMASLSRIPIVSTFHGTRPEPELKEIYGSSKAYNIAPSKYVTKVSPGVNFFDVIPHGVDLGEFEFNELGGPEFISIGRIIPEKGQLLAVEAADQAKMKLKIAGYKLPNEKSERYYYDLMKNIDASSYADFVGKVERRDVAQFMGKAKALIMPIDWDEAFGLVMIEAMATGTPIIAFDRGAVSEIVKDGITGYVVPPHDTEAMAQAMKTVGQIDRRACRKHVEQNFSLDRMVSNYEQLFHKVISGQEGAAE